MWTVPVGVYTATHLTKWADTYGLLGALAGIARFHKDYQAVYDSIEDQKVAQIFKEHYGDRF